VRKLTFVVILVAIVLLFTPPLLGMRAHDQLQDSLARSSQQAGGNVEMTLENYQRGWFSSQGKIRIALSEAYAKSSTPEVAHGSALRMLQTGITQNVRVTHGPLIIGESTSLGLGELVGTLDAQSHPDLKPMLESSGNLYLLRATLHLGFTGVGDIQLDAPPFHYTDQAHPLNTMVFAGAHAQGSLDVDAMNIDLQGEINGFSVASTDGELVLEQMVFAADMRYPESDPYGLGTGRVAIERAVATSGAGTAVHFRNAALEFSSSKEDAGTVAANMTYSTEAFTSGDAELRDFKLAIGMHNLDAGALAHLQSLNVELSDPSTGPSTGPSTDRTQILTHLQDPVYDLLAAGPVLILAPIEFVFADQPLSASLQVSTNTQLLPARGTFDIANPLMYVSLFNIDAEVSMHKNLAMQAAIPQLKAQLAAGVPPGATVDEAQLDAMAQAQAPMLLGTLLGQGMIIEEGDNYRVHASFIGGELQINGNPLPLGALLGAGFSGSGLQNAQ